MGTVEGSKVGIREGRKDDGLRVGRCKGRRVGNVDGSIVGEGVDGWLVGEAETVGLVVSPRVGDLVG